MNTLNMKNYMLLVRKIKEAQKDIREKTLALKLGQSEEQSNIERSLKPVIEPLEKIIKLKENRKLKVNDNVSQKITPKRGNNIISPNVSALTESTQYNPTDSIVTDTPDWDPFQTSYKTPSTSHLPKMQPQIWTEIFDNTIPEQPEKNVLEDDRRQSASNLDYYLNMLHAKDEKIDRDSGVTVN